MAPAGEMWSVVTKSPRSARARAPETSTVSRCRAMSKYGARRTYVDDSSHGKVEEDEDSMACQNAEPSLSEPWASAKSDGVSTCERTSATSSLEGTRSASITGSPLTPVPTGSLVRSTSMVPTSE